jgi:hypothetical protein
MIFHHSVTIVYIFWITYNNNMYNNVPTISFGWIRLVNHQALYFTYSNNVPIDVYNTFDYYYTVTVKKKFIYNKYNTT